MALINKLTAIANGIRTLDDTTSKYTLDEMAGSVDEANAEIDTQAAKIAQLSTILDGKAAGSGGSGGEVYTIEVINKGGNWLVAYLDQQGTELTCVSGTIQPLNNVVVVVHGGSGRATLTGDYLRVIEYYLTTTYIFKSNGTITLLSGGGSN